MGQVPQREKKKEKHRKMPTFSFLNSISEQARNFCQEMIFFPFFLDFGSHLGFSLYYHILLILSQIETKI